MAGDKGLVNMNKKGRAWGGVNLFRTSERFSTASALATTLPYGTGCEIAFDASGCNGREREGEREHPKPLSKQASKRERERDRERERARGMLLQAIFMVTV